MASSITAAEAFKYLNADGSKRPIKPSEVLTWATYVELAQQAAVVSVEYYELRADRPTADGMQGYAIVVGEAVAGNNGLYKDEGTWVRLGDSPGVPGPQGLPGDAATVDASSIRTAIIGQPALLSPADDDVMTIVDTSAGNLKTLTPLVFWSNYLKGKSDAEYVRRVNLLGNFGSDVMATTAPPLAGGDHVVIADSDDGNNIKRISVNNLTSYVIADIASADLGPVLYGTTNVTGLAPNDAIPLNDESASFALRHTTVGSLTTYFDSVFGWAVSVSGATSNSSLADADLIGTLDASATYGIKKSTLGDLDAWAKAKNDTRYLQLTGFTSNFAALIDAAPAMTTFEDADRLIAIDDSAGDLTRQITWGNFTVNITSTVWSDLGAKIAAGTAKVTPLGADSIALSDSAAADATKQLTLSNLDAWLTSINDTRYARLGSFTTQFATMVDAAPAITVIDDLDRLVVIDESAGPLARKITWASLKTGINAALWTAFGGLIAAGTNKASPDGTDTIALSDSAASGATKKMSFNNLTTWIKSWGDTYFRRTSVDVDPSDVTGLTAIINKVNNIEPNAQPTHAQDVADAIVSADFLVDDVADVDNFAMVDIDAVTNPLKKVAPGKIYDYVINRIKAAVLNTGLADADEILSLDTSAGSAPRRSSLGDLWTWITGKGDSRYVQLSGSSSQFEANFQNFTTVTDLANGDYINILDASASQGVRKLTFNTVWSWLSARFSGLPGNDSAGNIDEADYMVMLDTSNSGAITRIPLSKVWDWIGTKPEIAGTVSKLADIELNADVTDAANVGAAINGATANASLADADAIGALDASASNVLKKSLLSDVWVWIRGKFTGLATITDIGQADRITIIDASNFHSHANITMEGLEDWIYQRFSVLGGPDAGVASTDYMVMLDSSQSNAGVRVQASTFWAFIRDQADSRYVQIADAVSRLQTSLRGLTILDSVGDNDEVPVLDASAGRPIMSFRIGTLWTWFSGKLSGLGGLVGGMSTNDYFLVLDGDDGNAPKRIPVGSVNTYNQGLNDARYRKLDEGVPNEAWSSLPGLEPKMFTGALTGGLPSARAGVGGVIVNTALGKGVRLTGNSLLCQRYYFPVAYGQVYMVKASVIRSVNGTDPAGDAIVLGVAWYDKDLTLLTTNSKTEADIVEPMVADGLQILKTAVNGAAGGAVAIIPPPGAIYGSAYVENNGATPASDVFSITVDPVHQ
ncbi:hypothetical protein [Acuticoccus sediminis]|uniref:hypothetical protein n=1 Tax=Acuticoccus sediminis TaxID=2184697 RepID=UPI001CFCB492|nr:hypothetical protein [Acuticoccus sediminis]